MVPIYFRRNLVDALAVSALVFALLLRFGIKFSRADETLISWNGIVASNGYGWPREGLHRQLGEDLFESTSETSQSSDWYEDDDPTTTGEESSETSSSASSTSSSLSSEDIQGSSNSMLEPISTYESSDLQLPESEYSMLDLFGREGTRNAAFGDTSLGHYESEVFSFEEQTELDDIGHTNVSQCVVGTDVWNGYFTIPLGRHSGAAPASSTAAHLPIGQLVIVDVEVAADGPASSLSQYRIQACVTDSSGSVKITCAESNSVGKIMHSEEVELGEEVELPFMLEVSELVPVGGEVDPSEESSVLTSPTAPEDLPTGPTAVAYMTCVRLISLEANDLALPWVVESFQEDFLDDDDQPDGSFVQTMELIDTDDASLWSMFAAPFQSVAWLPQQMQKLLLRRTSSDESASRLLEEITVENPEKISRPKSAAPPLIAVGGAIVVGFSLLAVVAGIVHHKRGKGPGNLETDVEPTEAERREPSALRPVTNSSIIGNLSRSHSKSVGCPELTIPNGCRAIIVDSPSTAAVAHFVKTPRAAAWNPHDAAANPIPASSAVASSHISSSARSSQEGAGVSDLSETE